MDKQTENVVVDVTKSDVLKAYRFFNFKTNVGQLAIINSAFIAFLLVMTILVWKMPNFAAIFINLIVSISLFLFLVWLLRLLSPTNKKGVIGKHTITINEEGIRETTEYNDSLQRWKGIERILQDKDAIYFQFSTFLVIIVPKRYFGTKGEADKFYKLATHYWKHASMLNTIRL